jgi:Uma2 family endonuclease
MLATAARRIRKESDDGGAIIFDGNLRIPPGIKDLASFRDWTYSKDYPNRGDIAWLGGVLWVDLSMEQAYTHNQIKAEITYILSGIVRKDKLGYVFPDGMRFSHPAADLSCEPDMMFVTYETFQNDSIREIPSADGPAIELEGTPDMVLEVVSDSSIGKDTNRLMSFYFEAGIKEYWLVDVRGEGVEFEIFKRGSKGFVATRRQAGKIRSAVFGNSFQLTRGVDPLGMPQFTLTAS